MKTPTPQPHAVRIVVQPPEAQLASTVPGEPPSGAEAWHVAKASCPRFVEFASQYDAKKYWPEVYERVRRSSLVQRPSRPAHSGMPCFGSTAISASLPFRRTTNDQSLNFRSVGRLWPSIFPTIQGRLCRPRSSVWR